MGMREKLIAAARRAVMEERGRVFWILDQMDAELTEALNKKLLIETERHTIQVKLAIFRSVAQNLRLRISAGVRPNEKNRLIDDGESGIIVEHG